MPLTEAGQEPKTKESARLAPAAECAASLAKCFGFRKAGGGMPASRRRHIAIQASAAYQMLPAGDFLLARHNR
ncbi:hypothetical protein CK228_10790 [Mesorhizobium sp. WSM4312]|nr:hypothetical protein CK232_12345 [Mesorhizobium sp. WSM4304]PBB68317.1 hypothetical protein CK228_10790 [Mesorhizobium sp. WSM4312]PBB75996.1 hypothetical protein CK227_05790 [Mesorhizobium sp. WSM4308]